MTKKSFWDNSSLQQDIKWDNQELPGCPDEVLLTKNWNKVEGRRSALNNPINKKKYYENKDWLKSLIEKRTESLRKPEIRKKLSEKQKQRYLNEEERKKTSESIKESYRKDPNRIERTKKKSKETWSKEEVKLKASKSHKKQWEDPNSRKKLSESMKSLRQYPIMTPDGEFPSTQAAADYYGISKDMISYYRKKYPEKYYYCGKKPHSNKKIE